MEDNKVSGVTNEKQELNEIICDSSKFSFARSCKEETITPVQGTIKGKIPIWIKGSLLRNGSGLLEIGPDKFRHVFDGMALLHRYHISNGEVTYQNKFLRSKTYNRNMKANRIVVSEFGTKAHPDPCKTLLQRLMSMFVLNDHTDNDLVNIVPYGDEIYVHTETPFIHRIDPNTLKILDRVNFCEQVAVNIATAHPHLEHDGTVYNMGSSLASSRPLYNIIKFPSTTKSGKSKFDEGTVICSIPALSKRNPSYFHSFAMTENYFVFVEQPLTVSVMKLGISSFTGSSFMDCMNWNSNCQEENPKTNIVQLEGSQAEAYVQKNGDVFLKYEELTEKGPVLCELPRINYDGFNGKKYKYFYATGRLPEDLQTYLIKVDVWNKTKTIWLEEKTIPSEPVFVGRPGATEEDDGVILSAVLSDENQNKVFLLVLDASTFQELGRAEFLLDSVVPGDIHGLFWPAT
ncbi:beta,beta-carotene 15,15'-dioxygenase-like isoform X3 [Tachypleus tridentatus]|uniref:beta,beta-carotene 15,15'-dioxygenase-like isoform X3 n=1 Tax=Tachypleus tridentatus TaxID=6853 RepID=UPI003FD043DA